MAQKESHHREVVENLNAQLTQTRRQLDDLTTLSRDQASTINESTYSSYSFLFFLFLKKDLEHVEGN
jgi:hypothetical protein